MEIRREIVVQVSLILWHVVAGPRKLRAAEGGKCSVPGSNGHNECIRAYISTRMCIVVAHCREDLESAGHCEQATPAMCARNCSSSCFFGSAGVELSTIRTGRPMGTIESASSSQSSGGSTVPITALCLDEERAGILAGDAEGKIFWGNVD